MTKLLRVCLFALPLLIVPAQVHAWGLPPVSIDAGINYWLKINCGGPQGGAQAGPWYSYWPYEAHFQTPAPYAYPYWPAPASTTGVYPGVQPAVPTQLPPSRAQAFYPTGVQSVGYSQEAPSYWYGR